MLVITARERQNITATTGLYYICVFPHLTSTYSLLVQEVSPALMFKYLLDGYEENGEVQGSNMTVYMYKVPPLSYETEDIVIEFQLTTLSG